MKKNILILVLLCSQLLPIGYIYAKKITELDDFYKDPFLIVNEKQFYIWDRVLRKVFIYSKTNYEKIDEFGKRGEGPGEFISIGNVFLLDDYICVSSFPKLCFFSKKGKFKKEIKGPLDAGAFVPIGKNFIGKSYPHSGPYKEEGKIQFSLYNSNLKMKKDIYLVKYHKFAWPGEKKENILWIRPCIKAVSYQNKIIIGSSYEGFLLLFFDSNGNMLYKIDKQYEKRLVTKEEKKELLNEAKIRMGEKRWNEHKFMYNVVFPDYYPAFSNFVIENNKIYVFQFPKDETIEISILDLKGKPLDKKNIPLIERSIIEKGRFSIHDGKMYYVIDNIETENWELNEIEID